MNDKITIEFTDPPPVEIIESDAPANEKIWDLRLYGATLEIRIWNDARTSFSIHTIVRKGYEFL